MQKTMKMHALDFLLDLHSWVRAELEVAEEHEEEDLDPAKRRRTKSQQNRNRNDANEAARREIHTRSARTGTRCTTDYRSRGYPHQT